MSRITKENVDKASLAKFLTETCGVSLPCVSDPEVINLDVARVERTLKLRGRDYYQLCLEPTKEHGRVDYKIRGNPDFPIATAEKHISVLCSTPGKFIDGIFHKVHLRYEHRDPDTKVAD